MNAGIVPRTKQKGYIQNSSLILIALASTFFSRLFEAVGFPGLVNFLHFAIVPVTVAIVLANSKAKNRYQISTTWTILFGLLILFVVMLLSALLNKAGFFNVVLDFLLLGEPFLLLAALISIPLSPNSLERLQTWITRFCFINLFLAFLQNYVVIPYFSSYFNIGKLSTFDLVQGVYFISGGGNTLSACVSIIFSLYFFQNFSKVPLWIRAIVLFAAFWQVLISDSKQAALAFIVAWAVLSLIKFQDARKVLLYVTGVVVLVAVFYWCIENLEAFKAYKTYIDPYWYDLRENPMQIKLAALRILPTYYQSPLNIWFGLGPGHTVGRLGAGMLDKYKDLVTPLGATFTPIGQAVWNEFESLAFNNNIGLVSTIFAPFWGWVGIWGDLGFVGIGAYLYLGYLVWSRVCRDDLSKLMVFQVLICGFIFTQMEEPGYMLFVAVMLGLRWHEKRLANSDAYGTSSFIASV